MKTSTGKNFSNISFNARLLLEEMSKRNIELEFFWSTNFIKAVYKNHNEILYDISTNLISYPTGIIIDDKYFSKRLLNRQGFKVAPGAVFDGKSILDSLEYASHIKYPVVLKPTNGSHGDFVYLDIKNNTMVVNLGFLLLRIIFLQLFQEFLQML